MEKFKASFFVAKSFYPMIQRLKQEQEEKSGLWNILNIWKQVPETAEKKRNDDERIATFHNF